MQIPRLLAFDFDGVLCDGLQEYFQVAWRTYGHLQIAPNVDALNPDRRDFPAFAEGRSVIETGWEMPLLIHAIRTGYDLQRILTDWPKVLGEILAQPGIPNAQTLAQTVDHLRDRWIESDLAGWLELHRFYPGAIAGLSHCLAQGDIVAIVSTKEGRFIEQLLRQSGVVFPPALILGKEVKRSKRETLHALIQQYPQTQEVIFVEDRLATLQSVKGDPQLVPVKLYLAAWGYNTAADRDLAQQDDRIHLLETFAAVV